MKKRASRPPVVSSFTGESSPTYFSLSHLFAFPVNFPHYKVKQACSEQFPATRGGTVREPENQRYGDQQR